LLLVLRPAGSLIVVPLRATPRFITLQSRAIGALLTPAAAMGPQIERASHGISPF
jgi:hypothetical protein